MKITTLSNEFNEGDICFRISSDLPVIFYYINTHTYIIIYAYKYILKTNSEVAKSKII